MPPPRETSVNIRISLTLPETIESLAYIFAGDSVGLYSFEFLGGLRKMHVLSNRAVERPFKVIQGRWFSQQQKRRICDYLLINSNFGPVLHRFWDTATYWLKIVIFFYPTLI